MHLLRSYSSIFTLTSGIYLIVFTPHAIASQSTEQVAKQKLEYCANKMTYTPTQFKQIKQVHDQTNLSSKARLEKIMNILTPAQQQQMKKCLKS